jgi:hypothetical protein
MYKEQLHRNLHITNGPDIKLLNLNLCSFQKCKIISNIKNYMTSFDNFRSSLLFSKLL